MNWQGWLTLAVIFVTLVLLLKEVASPDITLLGALSVLGVCGVLTPQEAFSGFSNPALATVAALFVIAQASRSTGLLDRLAALQLSGAEGERTILARFCVPVGFLSAFMNNTTIVAMMTPQVLDYVRPRGLSPSRFLMPLSYATILGGVTTLIGTSTTLAVAGLIDSAGLPSLGFFELAPVGVPILVVGLAYLLLFGAKQIPARIDPVERFGKDQREYVASVIVEPDCPLVGQSIADANLRRLRGLFLVEIDRDGRVITPVGPSEVLQAGDRLVFAGQVDTIVDLQKIRGLSPIGDDDEKLSAPPRRRLMEAVISSSSPLVHRGIRESQFRSTYGAAVMAVHRNGERVVGKVGDIVLRPGDTLLLQADQQFLRTHRDSRDFYLVSEVAASEAPRFEKGWVVVAVFASMLAVVVSGALPISLASVAAAGLLVVTKAVSVADAKRSIRWSVLLAIGAGLGIAKAIDSSGVAGFLADAFQEISLSPAVALAAIYLITLLLAETLNHTAAATIMFPIALSMAQHLSVEPRGFLIAVIVAASCAFASPTGYQTHMIVFGAGGYRFKDFVKVGLPLDIVSAVVALTLIPKFWPL